MWSFDAKRASSCPFATKKRRTSEVRRFFVGDLSLAADCRSVQLASASKARAVISSTLPVPLMARYLGAVSGSAFAQSL